MNKLVPQFTYIFLFWCCHFMKFEVAGEITDRKLSTRLIEQIPMSKYQTSALILPNPERVRNLSKQFQVRDFDAYSKDTRQGDFQVGTESPKMYISSSPINLEDLFGGYALFRNSYSHLSQPLDDIKRRNHLAKEAFSLQEMHLRYLMASTAEQPDNSGRTSTINIWLTILIAALAAAILS